MHPDDFEKDMVRDYLGSEPGAFVEVGANHPTDGSQPHLFEQAGWRGILVEPQQKFQDLLRRERPRSTVVQAVCTSPERVGPQTLHIPLQDGFATLEPNKDDFGIRYGATETVVGRTLDSIIDEWRKSTGERTRIRLLAIDVEGHELEVLRGCALARHRPDLVLIEDKLQDLSKHRHLTSQGYRLVRRTSLNDWYIPVGANPPTRSFVEIAKLYRKVFLGLPWRRLRRWRHTRRRRAVVN